MEHLFSVWESVPSSDSTNVEGVAEAENITLWLVVHAIVPWVGYMNNEKIQITLSPGATLPSVSRFRSRGTRVVSSAITTVISSLSAMFKLLLMQKYPA